MSAEFSDQIQVCSPIEIYYCTAIKKIVFRKYFEIAYMEFLSDFLYILSHDIFGWPCFYRPGKGKGISKKKKTM